MSGTKEKKKGSCLKTGVIIVAVLVIIGAIGSTVSKDDSPNTTTNNDTPTTSKNAIDTTTNSEDTVQAEANEGIVVTNLLECPKFTAEKNSSAMIDQIASTAKQNVEALTDSQASEIIGIIRDADHKLYDGAEEMEKFMWYGYLLDYKYEDSDTRSSLGTDLCQAIKNVYRNVETVLDDRTHANLEQIDKALEAIQ